MEQGLNSEQLMIRYLLGELSAEERMEMEMDYFNDPERFNMLQVIEYDLVEGYINDKLSVADRARFERHYLTSPARREQVQFFQTLAKAVPLEKNQRLPHQTPVHFAALEPVSPTQATSWWQSLLALFRGSKLVLALSFATATFILAASWIWQITEMTQLCEQLRQTELERTGLQQRERELKQQIEAQQVQNNQLTQELKSIRQRLEAPPTPAPKSMLTTVSFTWTISGLRGTKTDDPAPRILRIPPGTDSVRLTFNLPSAHYSHYSVAMRTLTGEEIWSRSDLKTSRVKSNAFLVLRVPAKQFQKGSYNLALSGSNTRGEMVGIGELYIEVAGQEP